MIVDQKRFQEGAELKHQLHAQRIQKELKHQMYAQGIQKELKHQLHAQRIQKDRSYISGCLNPKRLFYIFQLELTKGLKISLSIYKLDYQGIQ